MSICKGIMIKIIRIIAEEPHDMGKENSIFQWYGKYSSEY